MSIKNKKIITLASIVTIIISALFLYFYEVKNNYKNFIVSKYELPDILNEVSSIAYMGNDEIACVQDEAGTIFIYNLKTKLLADEINFNLPGDYEGIEYIKENFYILRSDGLILEVKNNNSTPGVTEYNLNLFAKNNEGLAYDEKNDRLLISTKSKAAEGKESKDERHIYAFDLQKKELVAEPILVIDIESVSSHINDMGIELESKSEKAKKILKFRPSGLAIHPITNQIYTLSAIDNLIVSLDFEGNIMAVKQLDVSTFNKPEGIDFYDNGDALISNEGGDGRPTLFRVKIENL